MVDSDLLSRFGAALCDVHPGASRAAEPGVAAGEVQGFILCPLVHGKSDNTDHMAGFLARGQDQAAMPRPFPKKNCCGKSR